MIKFIRPPDPPVILYVQKCCKAKRGKCGERPLSRLNTCHHSLLFCAAELHSSAAKGNFFSYLDGVLGRMDESPKTRIKLFEIKYCFILTNAINLSTTEPEVNTIAVKEMIKIFTSEIMFR